MQKKNTILLSSVIFWRWRGCGSDVAQTWLGRGLDVARMCSGHLAEVKGKRFPAVTLILGWHACRTKLARNVFFSRHEFSQKNAPKFPRIFEPFFCRSEKNPAKFPPNSPLNFRPEKQKIHRRASAGAQGETHVSS